MSDHRKGGQALLAAGLLLAGAQAGAAPVGETAACVAPTGPAIRVDASGLKDRAGEVKLELYPANEADFLQHGRDLLAAHKTFRRVRAPTPQAGPVSICMRVPAPGRYGLVFTHNRDGKNKFGFWSDGIGLAGDQKLGRSRPKLAQALVTVGRGVTVVPVRTQYLRGLGGFGPL